MIQKYGWTEQCPACQRMKRIAKQDGAMSGRLGTNHSRECRERIIQAMMEDLIDRHIAEAYRQRMANQHDKTSSSQRLGDSRTQDLSESNLDEREKNQHGSEGSQMSTNRNHTRRHIGTLTSQEVDLERYMCKMTTTEWM